MSDLTTKERAEIMDSFMRSQARAILKEVLDKDIQMLEDDLLSETCDAEKNKCYFNAYDVERKLLASLKKLRAKPDELITGFEIQSARKEHTESQI